MKLGIIGCGLIGQKRAQAALNWGWSVDIVADLDVARASGLAAKAKGKATQDWRDVVQSDVDAVVIAATHDYLAPLSIAACEAGKHVIVEKPAGHDFAEVAAVMEAAQKYHRVVMVGFNHRFHPAMLKAREIVDRGELGPLMYVRGRYGHGGRKGYEKEWRCIPEKSGGGELIDQGAHLIDLSRWFLGDLTLEYAALPTLYWNMPVEDNCFLALKAAGGQVAWLHATWTEWKNMFSLEIVGRDGKLVIDGLGGSYGLERLTFYKMLPELGPPETTAWEYPFPDKSWDLEMKDFEEAIATGRRATGDIVDAYEMHRIIAKAYGKDI